MCGVCVWEGGHVEAHADIKRDEGSEGEKWTIVYNNRSKIIYFEQRSPFICCCEIPPNS